MFLVFNTPAFSETQSCERIRLDWSGFTHRAAAESWYPKNAYGNTYYDTKTANFNGRSGKLVIRDDKKRMDAFLNFRTSSGHKRIMKVVFLPNGEVHADLVSVGGYKTPGGAVYKCSNWYKNKIINTSGIKSNSNNFNSKNSSSTKFSSNNNRISDEAICNMATDRGSWRKVRFAQEYVQEAKKRGLSCGVYSSTSSNLSNYSDWRICDEADSGKPEWIKEAKRRGLNCGSSTSTPSSTSSLLQNYSDWKVCDEVKLGKQEWLEEAKRRKLNCGVNAAEAEKKRLEKIAEEKARQERIKAEQEKIKKKVAEKALKKKIAEEKARKIAEKKAKKEAEIKAKKLAQEKLKIKNAKEESVGLYKDIISYVKIANDIDVVQLSEFFENKPEPTKNWSVEDLKVYEKLKTFINKSINFREFHTKEKGKRAKAKLNLKLATLDKLEDNLKNFEIILKENFGNNQKTKLIRQYINKTKKIVSDDKYEQNQADKILSENETYLVTYKMNKNKLFEIDAYLNASKNELSQILKDNFGTTKGNKASKYLKNIDNAKSLSEKTELKSVIERFLNPPQNIVSVQKQANNKITSNLNSSELSNIPNNIICNRVDEGNTDYLLEAKRRGLNCATSVVSNQNNIVTQKNLSKKQTMIKSQKNVLEVRKNDTYQTPSEQKEFLNIVIKAQSSAIGASNDMQTGGYLSTRSKELCGILRPINFRVNNWVGTINDIDSNSDGKGVLSIKLAKDIFVQTWNNSFSDNLANANTLLEPNSPIFNAAAQMAKGDRVKFSGNLLPHKTHCIDEQSVTLKGKISEPEFTLKFSNIQKVNN